MSLIAGILIALAAVSVITWWIWKFNIRKDYKNNK